jgi:hypothetical protein
VPELNEHQAAELAALAAAAVPSTCQDGMAHERGSAYCEDHGGEVPELVNDLVCDLADYGGQPADDRVAAYLYGRSPELRAAVAVYFAGMRSDGPYDHAWIEGVMAALACAAREVVPDAVR